MAEVVGGRELIEARANPWATPGVEESRWGSMPNEGSGRGREGVYME
jgi:hypothetical protein